MKTVNGHAVLSPSGASRWLACTPSARLEEKYPDTAGIAAQEGTLAHALGETLILHHHKMINKREYNKAMKVITADPMYNQDMQDHAENYAAFVAEHLAEAKKRTKDAVLSIEAKLDMTDYVPEGFGTGDTVIIADGTMEIIDFKYGKGVEVSADNNSQMKLYAVGALKEFDIVYDIDTVLMTIYQPRLDNISSFEMPVKELRAWAENELQPKAELAFKGKGDFIAGNHCQFCKAKAQCRALADYNLEIAKHDFKNPDLLDDNEIADILERAKEFKSWLRSVEEYALKESVDNGKRWPGFKLVQGRSNRVYADQDKVAKVLIDNGYSEDLIYSKSLLGITAMEKALSKKEFADLLDGLVIKPPGKPTLAPQSDKRPEFNSTESAINDFSNN